MGEDVTFPLDREQYEIASQPPDQPLLVLAPPGTGKTHTVVARILYLIEEYDLGPNQLLVLCFSRAAVHEICRRLADLFGKKVHDDLRFVSVRTFDSFATSLLLGACEETDLNGKNYNQRIEMAVKALSHEYSEASELISGIQHLIVDEIQDLIGVRARLVQVLLTRISQGFTLLGDPAQAIYDFALEGDDDKFAPEDLLQWVRSTKWQPQLKECELTVNHRALGPMDKQVKILRTHLLDKNDNDLDRLAWFQEYIGKLSTHGNPAAFAKGVIGLASENTCILCRTNGEALQIATILTDLGKRCYLRPHPDDRGLPAWLGRVLGTCVSQNISKGEFESRWKDLVPSGKSIATAPRAWSWLKRVEGESGTDLDLGILRSRLYRGQTLPDDLDAYTSITDQDRLSISTIHAVKGREFDHIIILNPDGFRKQNQDEAIQEARVLYVAATRAKQDLTRLDRLGLPWMIRIKPAKQRWGAGYAGGRFNYIEAGIAHDIEQMSPVSKDLIRSREDAEKIQEYIWNEVHATDQVLLHAGNRTPFIRYVISHTAHDTENYRNIGFMSLRFVNDLRAVLKVESHTKQDYPQTLSGSNVTAVVTEVLPPYALNVHKTFAESRFCLNVRLRGMLDLT